MAAVEASFEIKSWNEAPFVEVPGPKLTRASVVKEYTGEVDGTSVTEWLMAYRPDESAVFVGLERITGRLAGREGTLVLQHVGAFEAGAARASLTVVSGTDELESLSGKGELVADPAGRITLNIES
jgi:hypothetical protein